jgi:hypothetical protein
MCTVYNKYSFLIQQESFPNKIQAVYIIKPEGFWERHKTTFKTSKLTFEVRSYIVHVVHITYPITSSHGYF